ncbi:MAG: type I-F CRISPR-associated helicase Cas3f, partial [Erythrobacter sp.]|nr:type I-F CRISPR-associated helicase Cas3f [Erythrobacter sp.]
LSDDQLAVRVGGTASRELYDLRAREAERSGSASSQQLMTEDGEGGVLFEGNSAHPLLQRLTPEPQVRALLAAPLLVCTVDHLTPATESHRGGHQIVPMLRLMSGDLVLDEPDDFDLDDLPALTRLVHWAGLLGARVLLSSATLPPVLVEGLFLAYLDGRAWFQRNRGERPGECHPICCAWFDEFDQQQIDCGDDSGFRTAQLSFALRRNGGLVKETSRRRGELLPLSLNDKNREAIRTEFALRIRAASVRLHEAHHQIDPSSSKRVSFGLVRMANIDPLFDVALSLYGHGAPPGVRIHLGVYHSRFPLWIRSQIEARLDRTLDRRQPEAVFALPEVRHALDSTVEPDQIFLVLASPVAEVGRDHDYDWAVVEPSSMRSLIQLAGRVRRHREGAAHSPNVLVFDSNLRHFEHGGQPAFCKPGFEGGNTDKRFRLESHSLSDLLEVHEFHVIDARPRLLPRPEADWQPTRRLTDLEHARLVDAMVPRQIATEAPSARDLLDIPAHGKPAFRSM